MLNETFLDACIWLARYVKRRHRRQHRQLFLWLPFHTLTLHQMSSNAILMKRMAKMCAAPAKEKRKRNAAPDYSSLVQPPASWIELAPPSSNKTKLIRARVRKHAGKLLQESHAIAPDLAISFVGNGGHAMSTMTPPTVSPFSTLGTKPQMIPASSVVWFQS